MNLYRNQQGVTLLEISDNLTKASINHLGYLIDDGFISHTGSNESTLSDRIKNNQVTSLVYGEIIGFSQSLDDLFNAWIKSDSHRDVISDSRWNQVGVGLVKKDSTYISVITFSYGLIKSTTFRISNNFIEISGEYIEKPYFKSGNIILEYIIDNDKKRFLIKTVNNKIIQVYNANNKLTDRIELFF